MNDDAKKIIHGMLGYPEYFIPFTGWAKLIGVAVILVTRSGRIKEWAYAGLFFDLAAAVYSGIAVSKSFDPMMLSLLVWIVPGVLSYVYWHKKMKLAEDRKRVVENQKEPALSY